MQKTLTITVKAWPVINLQKLNNTAFLKLENGIYRNVNFNQLLYIETFEKQLLLYFEDGECLTFRSPLYKLQDMLPTGFERIHRAYIVNMNHINYVDVNRKRICLKNNFHLSFGLSYRESIQKYFVSLNKNFL